MAGPEHGCTAGPIDTAAEPEDDTHISELPDAVLGIIYGHLGSSDSRQAMRSTCKAWRESPSICAQVSLIALYPSEKDPVGCIANFPRPCELLGLFAQMDHAALLQAVQGPGEEATRARSKLASVQRATFIWAPVEEEEECRAMADLMPQLQELTCDIHMNDGSLLLPLRDLAGLTSLCISVENRRGHEALQTIALLSNLKQLNFEVTLKGKGKRSTVDLGLLTSLTALEELFLGAGSRAVAGLGSLAVRCQHLQTLRFKDCSFCRLPPSDDEQEQEEEQQQGLGSGAQEGSTTLPAAWPPGAWASLRRLSFDGLTSKDMLAFMRVSGAGLPERVRIEASAAHVPEGASLQELGAWAQALAARLDSPCMALYFRGAPSAAGRVRLLRPLAHCLRKLALFGLELGSGSIAELAAALPGLASLDLRWCIPSPTAAVEAVEGFEVLEELGLPWPDEGPTEPFSSSYAAACAAAQAARSTAPGSPELSVIFRSSSGMRAVQASLRAGGHGVTEGPLRVSLKTEYKKDLWSDDYSYFAPDP